MKKPPTDSSFLSRVLRIFTRSSDTKAMKTARQARVRMQDKYHRQSPSGMDLRYRAAEIVVDDRACEVVRGLTGTRFLINQVPHLPVPDCTSRKCTCTYLRYQDRRNSADDRRAQFSALTNVYTTTGNTERRGRRGRRADDVPLGQLP